MSKPRNPPAFPTDCDDGMSLRDWFAGQALAGIGTWMPPVHDSRFDWTDQKAVGAVKAAWAFAMADAMLTERERNQ